MRLNNIPNTPQGISEATAEVERVLTARHIKVADSVRALLALEETMVKMSEVSKPGDTFTVRLVRGLDATRLVVSQRGEEMSLSAELPGADLTTLTDDYGAEAEGVIRDLVLRATADRIRLRRNRDVNVVTITVVRSENGPLLRALIALISGIAVGTLCRWCFPDSSEMISATLFTPLYHLFLSAVHMVMPLLVFFSIAASLTGFEDLGALGRTAGKVMGCYLSTTIVAILLAISFSRLIHPGRPGIIDLPPLVGSSTEGLEDVSIWQTIINIVPENFFGAFVNTDVLQVIFLALIVGIAVSRCGKYAPTLRYSVEALNELFGSVTAIISAFLPVAIFGAMAGLALTLNMATFSTLLGWAATVISALTGMMLFYLLLIRCIARLNPLAFMRKYGNVGVTGFLTSSSSATMPTSMECCQKLGIAPRIYSFSIPLGITVNMDGTSIFFLTSTLFVANLYGISIEGATLFTLSTTVLLLSVAAPAVPGAGTACVLILFALIGIPAEAFSLVLGIAPILELCCTALNVMGDGMVATLVARSENALDMEQYNA